METIPYPLRIPEEIVQLAKLRAKEEHLDQATALRQLLHLGAEDYVLTLIQQGRISVARGAEILDVSLQDIHRIAEKHNIHIGPTEEQRKQSYETMKRLLKK